jgi:hypothetical protein
VGVHARHAGPLTWYPRAALQGGKTAAELQTTGSISDGVTILVRGRIYSCRYSHSSIALAQTTQIDSAFFAVLKGTDTIAVETFAREGHELRGQLVKVAAGRSAPSIGPR